MCHGIERTCEHNADDGFARLWQSVNITPVLAEFRNRSVPSSRAEAPGRSTERFEREQGSLHHDVFCDVVADTGSGLWSNKANLAIA